MAVLDGIWGDADIALLALAAGALWLAAAAWLYATRRPLEPVVGARTLELGPEPPAIANLLVNGFEPTGEAVPATVIEELFRTRVEGGLLGSFGFDANGDITESPVTIVRVRKQGASTTIGSVDGAVIARVVRPSAKLVAAEG